VLCALCVGYLRETTLLRDRPAALLGLLALLALLAACAPLAAIAPSAAKGGVSDKLTIIYTGYGRGNVDPQQGCA
jgi:hypothetical protein